MKDLLTHIIGCIATKEGEGTLSKQRNGLRNIR